MIIVDRVKPSQTVILTLTESTTIEDFQYVIVLKCDATRNEYQIILPTNISPSTERYDLFELDTDLFNDMETGYFSFSVYQSDLLENPIEYGKLLIKDSTEVRESDQYIVYNL